jgi:thiamine pyrophosphate-dependent acetolactate synthase large subunit-like protein
VAVATTAIAVIDQTSPYYAGIYNGQASAPAARQAVEDSDCLLSVGHRPIDLTTGDFTASLPAAMIHLRGYSVDIGGDNYQSSSHASNDRRREPGGRPRRVGAPCQALSRQRGIRARPHRGSGRHP